MKLDTSYKDEIFPLLRNEVIPVVIFCLLSLAATILCGIYVQDSFEKILGISICSTITLGCFVFFGFQIGNALKQRAQTIHTEGNKIHLVAYKCDSSCTDAHIETARQVLKSRQTNHILYTITNEVSNINNTKITEIGEQIKTIVTFYPHGNVTYNKEKYSGLTFGKHKVKTTAFISYDQNQGHIQKTARLLVHELLHVALFTLGHKGSHHDYIELLQRTGKFDNIFKEGPDNV